MLKGRKEGCHILSDTFLTPIFIREMILAEYNEIFLIFVSEVSLLITPLAVVLVDSAVFFTTHYRVIQLHAAALANKLVLCP